MVAQAEGYRFQSVEAAPSGFFMCLSVWSRGHLMRRQGQGSVALSPRRNTAKSAKCIRDTGQPLATSAWHSIYGGCQQTLAFSASALPRLAASAAGQAMPSAEASAWAAGFLGFLQRRYRMPSDTLVWNLQFRLRCKGCNRRAGFRIAIFDNRTAAITRTAVGAGGCGVGSEALLHSRAFAPPPDPSTCAIYL